eukprot:CAMPEP_0206238582 /NCGR_PEP_ID=MMETSP0047_2-20121206/14896_1 /ASSEMBLY_ACC=CAM_ASM_000192 /TAXON_ID=195065 /ORGANISM="Chroomonas mesostigmatica_cf, Strain CCMP1168" /LENGTH=92 /DNA_ID=CAMNT_0053663135 /DNA_START=622 /DNA_END=897 /DNA_ORIENTATION=+
MCWAGAAGAAEESRMTGMASTGASSSSSLAKSSTSVVSYALAFGPTASLVSCFPSSCTWSLLQQVPIFLAPQTPDLLFPWQAGPGARPGLSR